MSITVTALSRPDDWNLALLVHLIGAFALVGALALALTALAATWRGGPVAMTQVAYRALLWGALPSWIVMRGGAQWIASKEDVADSEAAWIQIGYIASEPTLLFLIGATVLTGRGVSRAGADGTRRDLAATVLVSLTLIAYVVAIWAMTTKPI